MRTIRTCLVVLMLVGCALDAQPYIAYDDPNHPLAQTAVLSVAELQDKLGVVEIVSIDGREAPCVNARCPVWVRVLPGRHAFNVRITSRGAYIVADEYRVDVAYMVSGHVYVLDVQPGQPSGIEVRDLGLHPDYSVTLGPNGVDKQRHPVKFE